MLEKKYKSLLPGKAKHPLLILKEQGKKPSILITTLLALTHGFLTPAAALS